MPTDVGDMIERVEAVLSDIYGIVGDALEESEQTAIHYNQEQLLNHLRADGEYLKRYQSPRYAEIKAGMNSRPPIDHADARFTGELFDMMYMIVGWNTVTFGSDSEHAAVMENRDTPNIFGLSEESIEEYKQTYMPIAQRMVRERTVGIY